MINNDVQKLVIKELKDNYKLPKKGLVAGQAVASLIFKELDLGFNFFINDVDVFTIDNDSDYTSWLRKTPLNQITASSFFDSFSTKSINLKTYHVLNSRLLEEDEKVNVITISIDENINVENFENTSHDYFDIINSFDLNCCCVGFDLETEEFIFNDSFEKFCNDKTLHVNSARVPYHTSLRLIKKKEDLGDNLICNFDEELEALFACDIHSSFCVGHKFFSDFTKYANSTIKELFTGLDNPIINKDDNGDEFILYYVGINKVKWDALIEYKYSKKPDVNKVSYDFANNGGSYVHFYHINNDTGVFSTKYKEKMREIQTFNLALFKLLETKMIKSSLVELDLSMFEKDNSIEKFDYLNKVPSEYEHLLHVYNNLSLKEILDNITFINKNFNSEENKYLFQYIGHKNIKHLSLKELKELKKEEILNLVFKDKSVKHNKNAINDVNTRFFKIKQLINVNDFLEVTEKTCAKAIFNDYKNYCEFNNKVYYLVELFGKNSLICYYQNSDNTYSCSNYHGEKEFQEDKTLDRLIRVILDLKHKKTLLDTIYSNFKIERTIYQLRIKLSDLIKPKKNPRLEKNKIDKQIKQNQHINPPLGFDDDIPF